MSHFPIALAVILYWESLFNLQQKKNLLQYYPELIKIKLLINHLLHITIIALQDYLKSNF